MPSKSPVHRKGKLTPIKPKGAAVVIAIHPVSEEAQAADDNAPPSYRHKMPRAKPKDLGKILRAG